MNIKDQVQKMDAIVAQGAIVDAVKDFFADNAVTADYGNSGTNGKPEMIKKMEGFANAIAKVNGITTIPLLIRIFLLLNLLLILI